MNPNAPASHQRNHANLIARRWRVFRRGYALLWSLVVGLFYWLLAALPQTPAQRLTASLVLAICVGLATLVAFRLSRRTARMRLENLRNRLEAPQPPEAVAELDRPAQDPDREADAPRGEEAPARILRRAGRECYASSDGPKPSNRLPRRPGVQSKGDARCAEAR